MVASHPSRGARAAILSACMTSALLASCDRGVKPQGEAPPFQVEAITLAPRSVDEVVELPGRVEAVRTAEVRARVDGIVERRLYAEGTDVKEGAPLFVGAVAKSPHWAAKNAHRWG